MPVYRPGSWLDPAARPDWCAVAAAGRFAIPVRGGRFDRHFHAGDELWFIAAGKGRIALGAEQSYVRAGDIVLTRAGTVHDVLAVYEPLSGFFCEAQGPPGGQPGHRYLSDIDRAGHDVPALALPADFPGPEPCASR